MDSSMSCKFSSGNWKIIQELKEERRKLQQFDASTVLQEDTELSVRSCRNDDTRCKMKLNTHLTVPEDLHLNESVGRAETNVHEDCCDTGPAIFQGDMPVPLQALIVCLLNLPKFKKFVASITEELTPSKRANKQRFPVILFFVDVHDLFVGGKKEVYENFASLFHSKDLCSSLTDEPVSSLLISILEMLHEELLEAKNDGYIQKICIEGCRFVHKKNHTAISHLFRGYLKRKIVCNCGYETVMDEPFTHVSVPLEDFHQKSIIFKLVGQGENNRVCVSRFLFSISNWSAVKDLKEKLLDHLLKKVEQLSIDEIEIYFIDAEKKLIALDEHTKIMHLMCQEGEIWVYQISHGNLSPSLSACMSHSVNTLTSSHREEKQVITSTPVTSDISFVSDTSVQNVYLPKKENAVALIHLKLIWPSLDATTFDMILQFPRVCHGLHIFERLGRILNISHREFKMMIVSVKNKAGHCLFCLNSCCSGCPMQLNDKVMMSDQYSIVAKLGNESKIQVISVIDDLSVSTNCPINGLTMNECLSGFSQRNSTTTCPLCLQSAWKPSEMVVLKCPDIFIIQLPIELNIQQICYSSERFKPFLCKRLSKLSYSLQSVIINNNGGNIAFVKESDSWLHNLNKNIEEKLSSSPASCVELLFYIKNLSSPKSAIESKIVKRIKSKQRGKMIRDIKFSGRTGYAKKPFRNSKSCYSDFDVFTSGQFTTSLSPLTTFNDKHSMCNCLKCQTLDHFQYQILKCKVSDEERNVQEKHYSQTSSCYSNKSFTTIESDRSTSLGTLTPYHLERGLHKAIRQQDLKTFVQYLEAGADANHLIRGIASLHLTAAMLPPFGSVFTKLCLEHAADPNLASIDGVTPVHIAVMLGGEDILNLLLQFGGIPKIKDSQGRSAFDILMQMNVKSSENMLRLLRGEDTKKKKGLQAENENTDNVSLVHVSAGSSFSSNKQKQLIGDTTFEEVLFRNHLSTPDEGGLSFVADVLSLKESEVSQHFTDINNSNQSFYGSHKNRWFSFITCRGKFLKVRKSERSWITRVVPHSVVEWFNNLFK